MSITTEYFQILILKSNKILKKSEKIQKIIYRDTRYNIDFLYTAYTLKDAKIMGKYAIWLYKLMDAILKKYSSINTVNYVIKLYHYSLYMFLLKIGSPF